MLELGWYRALKEVVDKEDIEPHTRSGYRWTTDEGWHMWMREIGEELICSVSFPEWKEASLEMLRTLMNENWFCVNHPMCRVAIDPETKYVTLLQSLPLTSANTKIAQLIETTHSYADELDDFLIEKFQE